MWANVVVESAWAWLQIAVSPWPTWVTRMSSGVVQIVLFTAIAWQVCCSVTSSFVRKCPVCSMGLWNRGRSASRHGYLQRQARHVSLIVLFLWISPPLSWRLRDYLWIVSVPYLVVLFFVLILWLGHATPGSWSRLWGEYKCRPALLSVTCTLSPLAPPEFASIGSFPGALLQTTTFLFLLLSSHCCSPLCSRFSTARRSTKAQPGL